MSSVSKEESVRGSVERTPRRWQAELFEESGNSRGSDGGSSRDYESATWLKVLVIRAEREKNLGGVVLEVVVKLNPPLSRRRIQASPPWVGCDSQPTLLLS